MAVRVKSRKGIAACLSAALALAPLDPAGLAAAVEEDGSTISNDRLEQLEQELNESRSRLEERQAQAEELASEMARLRERSVTAALEVQKREARLTRIEDRLEDLLEEENLLVDRLKDRQQALVSVVAALQAMERNKPPALLVRPDDAVNAARSAMLLGSVVPDIHGQAEALGQELEALTTLRADIEDQRDDLRDAAEALLKEQQQLATLLLDKERLQKATQVAAAIEAARVARVAAEARDLRSLVEQLERRGAAVQPRLKPSEGQGELEPVTAAPADPIRMAEVKGRLRAPVAGRITEQFGVSDEAGNPSEGLTFRTRPGAQVVAPFDSKIMFAQPYRNYGHVLILAAADGYHFVLTGMAHIYGEEGQHLLAGEPVGSMGLGGAVTQDVALSENMGGTDAEPTLYFELRRNGTPEDPLPWLAGWTRPVSG